jgi:L-fuconolactonase
MRIDSHQHFWQLDPGEYPWIRPEWPIHRDFGPDDLVPLLDAHGLDGSVLVQARQTALESDWLLGLAEQCPRIKGVVGWVDLLAPGADQELERLAAHPRFVGVRHIVQDEPDDRFLLRPEFLRGVARLARHGLCYDVLVFERQLPAALEFVRHFPEQRFVLDHVAKPKIAAGEISPWRERIHELGALPNVACKVSGLVTEANWEHWSTADLLPYLDVVLEAFGPERLMYGSDWPVCTLAGDYGRVYSLAQEFAEQLSPDEQAGFFGGVAARWYGLGGA